MTNFIFKSNASDLQKNSQSILAKLEIQSANILYLTHRLDYLIKEFKSFATDEKLQTQVDEFFEDGMTSPQTDSETK